MPIDDALEKIQTNETDKKENLETTSSSFELLKEYIEHHKKVYEKENVLLMYDCQRMNKFVNSKIRFDKDLSLKVLDFSRNEILEIIGESNKELKELLMNTDIINYLPEPIQISNMIIFKSIPAFFKIENAVIPNDFAELERATDNLFLIPNLKIMSLFIEEGEKLRRYAEVIKDDSEALLMVKNPKNNDEGKLVWHPKSFEVNELKLFYDKTKIKDIKKMIDEVEELKNEIEAGKITYGYTYGKNKVFSDLKSNLYNRLKKYHPELTVEGESLQYDKKFIPELPIVVDDLDDNSLDDDIPF